MPKYLDIDGLRTLWAQITNKISHESNATAEALEGKADLVEGKIPASQLPSYVDDVLEYANKASFPATGEAGKIYLDLATNLTYRWSGTAYTEISPSLALGTTSSTAYRGDYGAAAYKHAVTNKGIAKSSGLYKITTNAEGHVTAATAVAKADITGLGIPAQDTTYENATTTTNGLMSSTDKTKLNSINLSALVKSVNGITPDSNGNVAIEVGGGTVSGDYLPLTGGTTTGKVYLANGSGVYGADGGWTFLGFYGTEGKSRGSLMLTNENCFHFNQKETGATYMERYKLPIVTTGLTGDVWYAILTSKNAVTVAQGGTGTNDPFKVGNNIYVKSLAGGTVIPANSDLNTYVTIGNYYCSSNANAATIANSPVTEAFNLQVYSMVGNHTTAPTAKAYRYFTQELTTLYGIKYIRSVYYNNSTTATFGGWRQILNSDYVPTAIGSSGCGVTVGLFENHPLVSVTLNGKQEWSLQRVAETYDIKAHFNNANGDWQNSAIILNSLNCLEQGVRKIYYHYSQLGLTAAATSYEIWAALPNDSSFVAHNSNFGQVTDTPNGYGIVQITKTNNNYGAGLFTRVNVATSDFYQASFYLNRTFDGWRKVITEDNLTDTKVTQTKSDSTTSTSYYLLANSTNTTTTSETIFNKDLRANIKNGTADVEGFVELYLGNATAKGSAGNKTGRVALYSNGTRYHLIIPSNNAITTNITHTLPTVSGTFLNTGNYSSYALPLTGGTLTGNLTISNSNNYSYLYLANQNGENIGGLYASDSENRLYLINHAPNSTAGKYEGYGLPAVTTDNLTDNKWYTILTSKNAVTVAQGGTGRTTLTSGYALVGNGTSAVALRAITNNTAKGPLEWTSSTGTNLVTSNTLAYWNGAYTGTSSNITVLGTITKGVWNGSAIPITHGGTNATTATGARENLLIKVSATAPSSPTTGTIWVDIS